MSNLPKKNVYTRIAGGLGNQMFQYAAGYALAKNLDAQLKLDISYTKRESQRDYILSAFDIKEYVKQSPRSFLEKFQDKITHLLSFKKSRLGYCRSLPVVYHPHFHFWSDFKKIDYSCYLYGHWQSPLYFSNVADEIAEIFSLGRFSSSQTETIENTIESEKNTVAVHLRLGDYLRPKALKHHGICSRSYYDQSCSMMKKLVENPKFFIFSDNIARARAYLAHWTKNVTFVSGYTQEQDMMLMSKCRHNILANSTFSWWATWLNQNESKVVIAPRLYFARETQRTKNIVDLYPDGWIII